MSSRTSTTTPADMHRAMPCACAIV
jgi:hypothetical protein